MEDMAAVDLNDIFVSEVGAEGIRQYTSYDIVSTGGVAHVVDNVSQTPNTANRIRGFGTPNFAVGGIARSSAFPLDTYNVDAVEISRGPNSSLFGIGEISGTVNLVPSSGNVTRDINKFTFRIDDYGGHRETVDVNRVIFKDKLAFRVLAAHQEGRFNRKPAYDNQDRYTLALTAKPFKRTTLRASYESYRNKFSRPNSSPPREVITTWINRYGAPTYNPVTRMVKVNGVEYGPFDHSNGRALTGAKLEPGRGTLGDYGIGQVGSGRSRPLMQVIDGQVASYIQQNASTFWPQITFFPGSTGYQPGDPWWRALPTSLDNLPANTDLGFFNWKDDNLMAMNYTRREGSSFNAHLEQMFIETARQQLGIQASYYQERIDNYQRSFIGNVDGAQTVIAVDINEVLPDGSPNPGFLRPYVTGLVPQTIWRPEENKTLRGNLAYQINLAREQNWTRWIGRHTIALYAEQRELVNVGGGVRIRDQVIENKPYFAGGLTSAGLADAASFPRFYLGDATGYNVDRITGRPNLTGRLPMRRYDTTTRTWFSDEVLYGEVMFARVNGPTRTRIETRGFVYQGSLLDDRIIPVIGVREDTRKQAGGVPIPRFGAPYAINPTTGEGIFDDIGHALSTSKEFGSRVSGKTETQGVVVKPFKWLHLTHNRSNSFNPQADAIDTAGNLLPQPTGNGKDSGIRVLLFEDKLALSLSKFKTFTKDSRSGAAGTTPGRAVRIDFDVTGNNDPDLEDFYTRSLLLDPSKIGWTPEQIQAEVLRLMEFPAELRQRYTEYPIVGVSDTTSEGYELELNYNTRNWSLKLTGNKIETVVNSMSPAASDYIARRLPIWQSATDLQGNRFWTTPRDGVGTDSGTPEQFYNTAVRAPLDSLQAFIGQPSPQQRRYNASATTNYRLRGISDNKHLSRTNVGGVLRWSDKAAIGFPTRVTEDGTVRYDYSKSPYYDKARFACDLWVGYDYTLFAGKVKARLQLNVRDVFENGGLRVVAVNSDGTPWNYRIIEPRSFQLTASFDL
jgi:hypothetical protein